MSMQNQERKKIGLALGGGGARGLAHIGVLRVLLRENIPIDCIAGTSMGGLVGALFCAGLSVDEIEKEAHELGDLRHVARLIDIRLRLGASGLLRGTRIYNFLMDKLGEKLTFDDLSMPLAVSTVDLNSGREVVLTKGSVAAAVRATISVPTVFAPVEFDMYRLVDGGMLNNVPADIAQNLGADSVIAVDVLPHFGINQPGGAINVSALEHKFLPKTLAETYNVQLIMVSALTDYRLKEAKPDVLIRPELPQDLGLFLGFHRPEVAIRAGEEAAEKHLAEIRALLD